jgi:hypothetical protein
MFENMHVLLNLIRVVVGEKKYYILMIIPNALRAIKMVTLRYWRIHEK